jgi:hypothetical protein
MFVHIKWYTKVISDVDVDFISLAGVLGGLVATLTAAVAAEDNAPVLHFPGKKQARAMATTTIDPLSSGKQHVEIHNSLFMSLTADWMPGGLQALYQLAALGSTLAVAIVGGLLAGFLVAKIDFHKQDLSNEHLFEDAVFWAEVEPEEADAAHGAVNGTSGE